MSDDPGRRNLEPALCVIAAARPASVRWRNAAAAAGSLAALHRLGPAALNRLGLGPTAHAAIHAPATQRLSQWQQWLAEPGHGLTTIGSPGYPPLLAELPDAPLALWTRGARADLLCGPQLAIVGSRHASAAGIRTARRIAAALGQAGLTITSGLAAGIDSAAHAGAVDSSGGTVAVLGSGIDRIYPRGNQDLAERLGQQGLIVSEYPPGMPPLAHQFPQRNRIIAGLSLGTLVVEAASRSGALITARLAGEYGRSVLAVPGPVQSALSRGCHRLLRSGACLVENTRDVLLEIRPELTAALAEAAEPEVGSGRQAGRSEAKIVLDKLDFSPVTLDELRSATGLTAAELSSMLLHLELEGTVDARPDGRYCRRT